MKCLEKDRGRRYAKGLLELVRGARRPGHDRLVVQVSLQIRRQSVGRLDYRVATGGNDRTVRIWDRRRIRAIPIGRRCNRLHFLNAAIDAYSTHDGTTIGTYTLRYADGRRVELSIRVGIRVGIEVADWWNQPDEEGKPFTIAWTGGNERTCEEGRWLRLFKTTWENPTREIEVCSLDFSTESREGVPFLVALTAE